MLTFFSLVIFKFVKCETVTLGSLDQSIPETVFTQQTYKRTCWVGSSVPY